MYEIKGYVFQFTLGFWDAFPHSHWGGLRVRVRVRVLVHGLEDDLAR